MFLIRSLNLKYVVIWRFNLMNIVIQTIKSNFVVIQRLYIKMCTVNRKGNTMYIFWLFRPYLAFFTLQECYFFWLFGPYINVLYCNDNMPIFKLLYTICTVPISSIHFWLYVCIFQLFWPKCILHRITKLFLSILSTLSIILKKNSQKWIEEDWDWFQWCKTIDNWTIIKEVIAIYIHSGWKCRKM